MFISTVDMGVFIRKYTGNPAGRGSVSVNSGAELVAVTRAEASHTWLDNCLFDLFLHPERDGTFW